MKLQLPDVTLVIYEVRAHTLGAMAVKDCMDKAEFAEVHIHTDDFTQFEEHIGVHEDIKYFKVDGSLPKDVGQAYLWHEVPKYIGSSHVLNIEWDSFIINPEMWDNKFLEFDFIGAPWPWRTGYNVGNGGFSLLSRELLKFLEENRKKYPYSFPWDGALGLNHRKGLEGEGFVWAPWGVASAFAFESGLLRNPRAHFGFHDCRNFPYMLTREELLIRLNRADDYVRAHKSWELMLKQLGSEKPTMIEDYSNKVYDVRDMQQAKNIILTPQSGMTVEDRWQTETPYLIDLILEKVPDISHGRVLDFGCGVGRMSKALMDKLGYVAVTGVDTSWSMRALAENYVRNDRFFACSSLSLESLIYQGCNYNLGICTWVLQHCLHLELDLKLIGEALSGGGYLFVVNDKKRIVPNQRGGWSDDGLDIRKMLRERTEVIEEGAMDPKVVGEDVSRGTFWGVYRFA